MFNFVKMHFIELNRILLSDPVNTMHKSYNRGHAAVYLTNIHKFGKI